MRGPEAHHDPAVRSVIESRLQRINELLHEAAEERYARGARWYYVRESLEFSLGLRVEEHTQVKFVQGWRQAWRVVVEPGKYGETLLIAVPFSVEQIGPDRFIARRI